MKCILANSDRPFDVIVVGSGAGGSAAVHRLTTAGLNVLLLEKGYRLPQDGSTLDVDEVVNKRTFKSHEIWCTGKGRSFVPEEYFNLGGKTKWYGAALARFSSDEFEADTAHQCTGWPISYTDFEPHYQQAEAMLGLTTFPPENDLAGLIERLALHGSAWRTQALALGLSLDILRTPAEAARFDGFALPSGNKADAEKAFLAPLAGCRNLQILQGAEVIELLRAPGKQLRIDGIRLADGRIARAPSVILSAGALHSPRLLQRFFESQRLAAPHQLGRNFKCHLLTAVLGISRRPQSDLLRKTTLFLNDRLPHSSAQPLGFDAQLLASLVPWIVPRSIAKNIGRHGYGFFLQTEDGTHEDNRVIAAGTESNRTAGRPSLDYDARRTPAARQEHKRLVSSFRRALLRCGYVNFAQPIGIQGTAHACGTMIAGHSPQRSVVNPDGGVHGVPGLFVADGSVLPRISRVNPALTIFAWGLRVADRLAAEMQARTSVIRQSEQVLS